MQTCTATCPELGAPCRGGAHAPAVAHHATGVADDGTRWSVFWWHPAEVATAPERPLTPTDGKGSQPGRI